METPTLATVVFLRNKAGEICLAQKKKPIHHGAGELTYSLETWNGYGGKQEESDKTIEDTAIRELEQESDVFAEKSNIIPCGHIYFFWPNNENEEQSLADMEVFFYFLDVWTGEPREGAEMGPPQFFSPETVPYDKKMEGDALLLPRMLSGEMVSGSVYLGKKDAFGRTLFVPSV